MSQNFEKTWFCGFCRITVKSSWNFVDVLLHAKWCCFEKSLVSVASRIYILASKGYKVICLLFYKTEWYILFTYCKHNVCCLEWICQIWSKFSEAKLRHVSFVLHDLHDLSAFGYYGSQIVVVVERECS